MNFKSIIVFWAIRFVKQQNNMKDDMMTRLGYRY